MVNEYLTENLIDVQSVHMLVWLLVTVTVVLLDLFGLFVSVFLDLSNFMNYSSTIYSNLISRILLGFVYLYLHSPLFIRSCLGFFWYLLWWPLPILHILFSFLAFMLLDDYGFLVIFHEKLSLVFLLVYCQPESSICCNTQAQVF